MRRFEADATKSRQDPMRHRRAKRRRAEKSSRSSDIANRAKRGEGAGSFGDEDYTTARAVLAERRIASIVAR